MEKQKNSNSIFPPGLSHDEAARRLAIEGSNEIAVDQRRSWLTLALEVLREPMFLLLLGAGTIYLALGDMHEAVILLGFVVIIMGITLIQAHRTEGALAALRDLSSPRARVIRAGAPLRVAGRNVVRGDIVLLAEGDRIPADGQVLQAHDLAVDESMLSGESVPVSKLLESSELFASTLVVRGHAVMLVSATGQRTRFGEIGQSLKSIRLEDSPLRREVALLTRHLAILGLSLCALLTFLYWLLRGNWLDALLAGISLAMGVLPQEFSVIMIVFLALAARRIAHHGVLTRHLGAIETLGQTTVLCVDKTGTLTENRMTVAGLCVNDGILETASLNGTTLPEAYHELLEYAVLASEASPHDPMEVAFVRFAHAWLANTEHLHPDWELAHEYELSPELLAMSHLWRKTSGHHNVVATKGAPEAIADLCHLPQAARQALTAQAEKMAARGWRILGVAKAYHNADQKWPAIQHDFDFTLVGLIGLVDPLRAEVPQAVAECQTAGIRVIMITGDHPQTARAIAKSAGLSADDTLTGTEIANLDTRELAQRLRTTSICARVSPAQKLAVVEALKANGEVVAMTGDGVNDAPALKAAHIGIAMGKRGTDVAREAAALVLLEDDFAAIVAAVRLGRRIFANLRQALIYTLAVHIPIIGLAILPIVCGLPLVLTPLHIALLELIIDPSCSLVFEAEQGRSDLMKKPPRALKEPLITNVHLWLATLQGGLVMSVVSLAYASWLYIGVADATARTLAFVMLVVANAGLILPSRSDQISWRSLFQNLPVIAWLIMLLTLFCLTLVTWIPMLNGAFGFHPPQFGQWGLALLLGFGLLVPLQLLKRRILKNSAR